MSKLLTLRFQPQAWVNDYAIDVDAEGPTEFVVEFEGETIPADDSYESDDLRFLPGAPKWIREWQGPFYICVIGVED
jgi:hypothetical protein